MLSAGLLGSGCAAASLLALIRMLFEKLCLPFILYLLSAGLKASLDPRVLGRGPARITGKSTSNSNVLNRVSMLHWPELRTIYRKLNYTTLDPFIYHLNILMTILIALIAILLPTFLRIPGFISGFSPRYISGDIPYKTGLYRSMVMSYDPLTNWPAPPGTTSCGQFQPSG